MSIKGLGVDIVKIERFQRLSGASRRRFIENIFTKKETEYCSAFADPASHFAGTFAAKEAVCKALGGTKTIASFEIRRSKNGKPEVWHSRKKLPIAVSIAHEGDYAVAICIA